MRTAAILAPPPAGAVGVLGVGAGATGAGPVEETVELARPIFGGVASFDDIELFLDTFARPIVNGIIPDAAEDFLEFFSFLLPLVAEEASSSFFFDHTDA